MKTALICLLVVFVATTSFGVEKKAYQFREDFGTEALYDCALQYYYYIPCPTYSWFWAFTGWTPGDIIGTCFLTGDQGTGGWEACDPWLCQELQTLRVLDFAGYGTVYVGWFSFDLDVFCAPESCCGSIAPFVHLWHSGPHETSYGWNYFDFDPGVCLGPCCLNIPLTHPAIVVTATMTGTDGIYPAWGTDNISTPVETGCIMHDYGCMPVAYPRGRCGGEDPKARSGYVGTYWFEYWPPLCLLDGRDTTPDGSHFGCLDLAWRIYLICGGPTSTQPSTWGSIKSMYE